ncbi:Ig-like and fibronectin type-III domain-containing protein 2 isoform X2 [Arctopsyche grandis]|uniref:Ig-like and fibronectin type-III domain-containing protein 2 isoform X2 n=1 Tax=Arctopsyche grandis TaxID=121162 RepID=UPI00406D72C3
MKIFNNFDKYRFIILLFQLASVHSDVTPSIRDALPSPVHVQEGEDALVTCVIRNGDGRAVLWKRRMENGQNKILTAGDIRTAADTRYSVLHETAPHQSEKVHSAGDVWVLVIRKVKPSDSGMYICEVNSDPVVRSFHALSVLPRGLVPPENTTDSYSQTFFNDPFSGRVHNYTDCCVNSNVSQSCLGFCNIQNILDGNTGQDPEYCEQDFPIIVRCMADGRDHVPCCIQERVPDICQDVCRGEYTIITDNIKTHFSCSAYTEQTLACIVEGIELLPSPPEDVEVEALSQKSFKISWSPPTANHPTVTNYRIVLKALRSFDAHLIDSSESSTPKQKTVNREELVSPDQNSTVLNDLSPFTMYEITVAAVNKHGSSLPSYALRALTLNSAKTEPSKVVDAPALPNITKCCIEKGITHSKCVNKLCDPKAAGDITMTDLMICAPWAADTFTCLSNGIDHTACCKNRGLPDVCQSFCSGNISTIDFNHFKCIRYMSEYSNCLLQGYGVIPGPPTRVHVTNIATDYAIVHWASPRILGDTVQHYNVHYRRFTTDDNDYAFVEKVYSPYILEDLDSNVDYEVFIVAVNNHGIGEPSTRLIFKTQSKIVEEEIEKALSYNVTECCESVSVSSVCMPLCSYDASMIDLKLLAGICSGEFHKLIRCGAGGRNHGSCCARRGVASACQSICTGVIADSLHNTAKNCIPFIGNIVQCFEEGTGLLPGPIEELHATKVTGNSIDIQWLAPSDTTNITGYIVYYQKVDNTSAYETPLKLRNLINTTDTSVTITNLENGGLYNIFVVTHNEHGTSLPSSILMINCSGESSTKIVNSVPSPPHALAVSGHSATWVTISWQPPEFSHPQEIISYEIHHKSTGEDSFSILESSVTSHTFYNLTPNTQYIIYVTANSTHGKSMPSETLIAWTDPAYPAFVEPPTVHPINLVMEGSSMSILCIAMGTPTPTISLYISGRLVRQDTARHMVTVIHNVTRDMDQISCYADNGYGAPMQASRKITISHVPAIQASGITMAAKGDSVSLECRVSAQPRPQLAFWKDPQGRVPVIQGPKYDIKILPDNDEEDKFTMRLTINQISETDEGDYYCHAENAFGSAVQPVSVRIRNVPASHNITQCCMDQNVSSSCMDACSFYLDIDAVIDKPECIADFDKLMKCAADGSDHRSCCVAWGVPRRCLDWCRGEPLPTARLCVLSHTRQIVGCFHEGRDKLPGPPQNIKIVALDSHSVKISWEPPIKNPHTVDIYRVFWRPIGLKIPEKIDTLETELTISSLKDGVTYECVVKAGNHLGTSTLTEPLQFTMNDKYITHQLSPIDDESSHTGVTIGIALACLIVAGIVVVAVWLVKYKKILGLKSQGGVAFENPSYLREMNSDTTGNHQNPSDATVNNSRSMGVASVSAGTGWRPEALQFPQEVNPTLYEELKLGQDGAGFKRLKP